MKLPENFYRGFTGLIFASFGFWLSFTVLKLNPVTLKVAISLLAGLVLGAIGVYVLPFITKALTNWMRFLSRIIAAEVISQLHIPRMPSVGRPRNPKEKWVNPILVDTSTLIDGRIAEVVASGFLFGTVIVPDFILTELQHIADNADSIKRSRGRRGLDVLEQIKKSEFVKTEIYETGQTSLKKIDERLLKLGKVLKAKILTNDFNLNKVATVSGVKILNVNLLANAMKTPLIPGEGLEVKVIQLGKEKTQGVGYLPDGTMIVVENGAGFIGKKVPTKVSRVIQTVAGRMIFVQYSE